MINRNILETQLLSKFRNLTLHSIVNECFIEGLPFTKKDLDQTDIRSLSKYSLAVLKSIGGYDVANEALTSLKDVKQKSFLSDILTVCNNAALEATRRIASETDCKNPNTDIDKVVDKAAFTDEEYNKFKSSTGNIDLKAISDIINVKTLAVIQSEKDLQTQDDEMKEELQSALAGSRDFKDVATESYLDLVLNADVVRTPVTFFSRLIEASFENLLYTKEEYKEIPFETLGRITFENTLNVFKRDKTPIECLESLISVNSIPATLTDENKGKLMDTSLICSITIYTVLEVLKTLHIFSPGQKEIESFIKNTPSCGDIIAKDRDTFMTHCNNNIEDIRRYCVRNSNPQDLSNARSQLLTMKEKLANDTFDGSSFLNAKSEVMASIDSLITHVTGRLNALESGLHTEIPVSHFEKRAMESDVAQISRINSLFGSNVNISDIYLSFDPADESINYIDVVCKNNAGQTVGNSFIEVSHKPKDSEKYVKESFGKSALKDTTKNVHILHSNGTGKSYKIN